MAAYRFESADLPIGGSILDQIGNTPLLRLEALARDLAPGVEVYGKAEWFNPGGSVKDRPIKRMLDDLERTGRLTRDKVILDSTSGNAGIAYAMIGAARGHRVELVVPGNVSAERRAIIEAYGAAVVISDPLEGSDGAIRLARAMVARDPDRYVMPDQYNNPSNWRAHYDTTGPEIIAQTHGRVTHFVAGVGTSGTLVGVGRRLREWNPAVTVVGAQPDAAFHGIEGWKHIPSSIVPGIYDAAVAHRSIGVRTEDAYEMARRLAGEEGWFAGPSAGAAVFAALLVARELERGVVVTILPDGGDRYLSTALWRKGRR